MKCSYRDICLICVELKKHLPFAILSTCLAIVVIGFLSIIIGNPQLSRVGGELFHIFHPLHILASAAATTAMYWIHRRKFINATMIGVSGAIVICSLSDYIPFFRG